MGDQTNGNGRNGSMFLRWWQVIAWALALLLAGFGGWSSTTAEIRTVQTEFRAHKESQAKDDAALNQRLERMENKIDRLLEAK